MFPFICSFRTCATTTVRNLLRTFRRSLTIFHPAAYLSADRGNALLHGIMMKEEKKGTILLTGWREENDIVFVISDDGAGIPPEKLDSLLDERTQAAVGSSSRHVGVSNTNLRLKACTAADTACLSPVFPDSTEVTVRIPARRKKNFK